MCGASVLLLMGALIGASTSPTAAPLVSSSPADNSQVELLPATAEHDQKIQKLPINLARVYLGATIWVKVDSGKTPDQQLDADMRITGLIRDDDSFRFETAAGKTSFIIGLPQNTATNRFSVVMEGAEGTVQIFASNTKLDMDSRWWQPLAEKMPIKESGPMGVEWAWADVRYLKVEIDLKKGGNLAPFGLFGAPTIGDVKVVSVPGKVDPLNSMTSQNSAAQAGVPSPVTRQINVANAASRGRVTHVTSGLERPQAPVNMIDEDVNTGFTFDESDPNPSMLIALDDSREVCRVTAYYQAPPGSWEIYPLNKMPGDKDQPETNKPTPSVTRTRGYGPAAATPSGIGSYLVSLLWAQTQTQTQPQVMYLPPDFFKDRKASSTISNDSGKPYGAVDFHPKSARLILMRWVPQTPGNGSVRVYQVSVFTDPHREWYDALPTTNFASLGDPDLGGARGLDGNPIPEPPAIPVDPPQVISN